MSILPSPLVGTWSGTSTRIPSPNPMASVARAMSGMIKKGPCTLTLKGDGTGFLKVPLTPERAIAWCEEDGKVILRPRYEEKEMWATVATLSADKQKLDLDLGFLIVAFSKQPDAK